MNKLNNWLDKHTPVTQVLKRLYTMWVAVSNTKSFTLSLSLFWVITSFLNYEITRMEWDRYSKGELWAKDIIYDTDKNCNPELIQNIIDWSTEVYLRSAFQNLEHKIAWTISNITNSDYTSEITDFKAEALQWAECRIQDRLTLIWDNVTEKTVWILNSPSLFFSSEYQAWETTYNLSELGQKERSLKPGWYTRTYEYIKPEDSYLYSTKISTTRNPYNKTYNVWDSDSIDFERAPNFELTKDNTARNRAVHSIGDEIFKNITPSSRIEIKWISSPEWESPLSLIWEAPEDKRKNELLAYNRAQNVYNTLIDKYPELKDHIVNVSWVVQIISPEDLEFLTWISSRLTEEKFSLEGIQALIKNINNNDNSFLTLEELNRINEIFRRWVDIQHTYTKDTQFWDLYLWSYITDLPMSWKGLLFISNIMILLLICAIYNRWSIVTRDKYFILSQKTPEKLSHLENLELGIIKRLHTEEELQSMIDSAQKIEDYFDSLEELNKKA